MNPDYIQLKNTEELRTLREYADKKRKQMKYLFEKYSEIENVRAQAKTIFDYLRLRASDSKIYQETILKQIVYYQKFYEEIWDFALEITGSEGINCEQLRRKIFLLKKSLSEVYQLAERHEHKTSIDEIDYMHRSFIREYEELLCIVRDFENAALFEILIAAQNGWRRDREEMADIRGQLRDMTDRYNDICERFDGLANMQQTLTDHNCQLNKKVDEIIEILRRFIP